MNETDDKNQGVDALRQNPMGRVGGKSAGSAGLFSALLGYTIGFFIAAATVVVIRGVDSETDGINALTQALMVLGPAIFLLVVGIVIRKKGKSPAGVSKPVMALCAAIGLAAGGAIWVTAPTQEGLAQKLLEENRELIKNRAEQLAACREQIDAYPVGSVVGKIAAEQLAELKSVPMNLNRSKYNLGEGWNTLLASDTDFVRLKAGTDPDALMREYDRPKPSFRSPDTYDYSSEFNGMVDDLAEMAYGDPYVRRDEVEEMIEMLTPLRYVVIVRMGDANPPLLTGDKFLWGYLSGEAFCFDLEEKRLIAAFPFSATNSEKVEYSYAKNSNVTSQADSASQSLLTDLEKNAWPAFWHELHELAGAAVSSNKDIEIPFKAVTLDEARLVFRQKQIAEAERERKVKAELDRVDSDSAGAGGAENVEPAPVKLSDEQVAEVRKLLVEGGKVAAVKRVRELTGQGLAASKAIVDALEGTE